MKEIKNLINNQTFLIEDPDKDKPVTPCMDVYKDVIQYYGSLDKIKLIIVVRVDLHNKELVGYTWSPTASMRTLEYFLADETIHKTRVRKLDGYFRKEIIFELLGICTLVHFNKNFSDEVSFHFCVSG